MTVVRVELEYTEIQAHRGGMGLWPENTIMAMKNAIDLGVDMLELDLMISKDSLVVVSHEEIMSSEYVTKPDGTRVTKAEEASLVLFGMPYDDIRRYDTGLAGDSRYPARYGSLLASRFFRNCSTPQRLIFGKRAVGIYDTT